MSSSVKSTPSRKNMSLSTYYSPQKSASSSRLLPLALRSSRRPPSTPESPIPSPLDTASASRWSRFPSRIPVAAPVNGQRKSISSTYITRNGSIYAEGYFQTPVPVRNNGHPPSLTPPSHVSKPLNGASSPVHSRSACMRMRPLYRLSATAQQPSGVQSPYISPPVGVPRPLLSAADHPGAALAHISRQIHRNQIPQDCLLFCKTPREFNRCHPFFDHMFLSAAIFTHHARDPLAQPSANTSSPYIEPRLLMLKRSATDPDGYANHWEMPAGPCQSTDQSVLHGLARAAWLQTKLNIFFIARQIGKGNTFSSEYKVNPEIPGDENWYKPCFEVYCSEVQKLLTNQAFRTKAGFEEMVNKIPVRLQADLHQSWSWMTKEEAQLMLDGKVPGEQFVNTVQGRRAIRAFEIRLDQAMQLDPEGSQGRKRLRGNDTDTKSKGGWSLEKA